MAKTYTRENFKALTVITLSIISIIIISCKNPKADPKPAYSVPATYNFENVNYSGQSQRISMLEELSVEMKKGNAGEEVSAQTLKEMYANVGGHFNGEGLNASGKQLKDKTFNGNINGFNIPSLIKSAFCLYNLPIVEFKAAFVPAAIAAVVN